MTQSPTSGRTRGKEWTFNFQTCYTKDLREGRDSTPGPSIHLNRSSVTPDHRLDTLLPLRPVDHCYGTPNCHFVSPDWGLRSDLVRGFKDGRNLLSLLGVSSTLVYVKSATVDDSSSHGRKGLPSFTETFRQPSDSQNLSRTPDQPEIKSNFVSNLLRVKTLSEGTLDGQPDFCNDDVITRVSVTHGIGTFLGKPI